MSSMTAQRRPPTAETVWRQLGDELRRFVRRRIADPDRVDDVVGEILLRMHRSLPTVADERRVAGWVYEVARNAIADDHRRHSRLPIPVDGRGVDAGASDPADHWIDDQGRVERELAACARPLLQALAPRYRRALELTELEGLTQAEAARREGVSLSGMKSRVQRGRRQLREQLDRCCELTLDARGRPMDARPRDGDRTSR